MSCFTAIVIDCETGGLSCLKNPMTQIALQSIKLSDFSEISRYESYIKPYNSLALEEKALQFTGITHSLLEKKGQDIKAVVQDLIREFKTATVGGYTKKPILVGHNIQFDIGFIQYAFKLCKEDLSKYLAGNIDGHGNFYPSYLDSMWLSRLKYNHDTSMTKFTLTSCCEKRGIDIVDAHSAQNDVTATRELSTALSMDMRNGGEGTSNQLREARFRDNFTFQI